MSNARGPPERPSDERDDEANIGDEEAARCEDRKNGLGDGGAGVGPLWLELKECAACDGEANRVCADRARAQTADQSGR